MVGRGCGRCVGQFHGREGPGGPDRNNSYFFFQVRIVFFWFVFAVFLVFGEATMTRQVSISLAYFYF